VYDLILSGLPEGPADVFVLPHFTATGTPWLDPLAKGAIVGLTLATSRKEIVRAILEGITYEMALNLKYLAQAGVEVGELRAVGGGARSSLWLQLKSNLLGQRVVRTDVTEAVCLGAAILAGWGIGAYPSPASAVKAAVRVSDAFEPDPVLHQRYRQRLATYERIYPAVRQISA
jgi:xylulokinase